MEEDKEYEHPSYAVMSFSRRQSSGNMSLFGSSIKHHNTICLTIKKASKYRHLNKNWYHGNEKLIEIEMSPTQFTDAITTMNTEPGVPVTLRYIKNEEKIPPCPDESQRVIFEEEFKRRIRTISNDLINLEKLSKEILNKPGGLKKIEKETLDSIIFKLVQNVRSNIPFIQSSYNEAIDKTTNEAKGEIEAFFQTMITNLGIEAFKDKFKIPQIESNEIKQIPDINIDSLEIDEEYNF